MTIDVDSLKAIDVHVHAERNRGEPQDEVTTDLLDAAAKYFGTEPIQPTAQEVAEYYRERRMMAEELQVPGVVRCDQHLQKQSAEQRRENLHRQKIARSAGDPLRSIPR